MFARTVRMQLKPNSVAEFTSVIEKEIIPLLRKQQGFRDEITFLPPDNGKEAGAISLWEQKENGEANGSGTYPNGLKAVAKGGEGTPQAETCEVSKSACHRTATREAVGALWPSRAGRDM